MTMIYRMMTMTIVTRMMMMTMVYLQNDDDDDGVQELYEKRSLLIMGRGYNYATCLEGALKVAMIIIMLTAMLGI